MKIIRQISSLSLCAVLLWGVLDPTNQTWAADADDEPKGEAPALTIYNQQFAVVRQKVPLDLKLGVNHIQVTDITAHLEPDSVILRPLDTGRRLQILEQNYRNDPVSQQLLLSLYEGKTIDFLQTDKDANPHLVQGKIIRSGYVPHYAAFRVYGQQYNQQQAANAQGGGEQPVIEVNGKLQFSLPGQPLFPALADDTVLKPTLAWELQTDKPGATTAEFSYVTGGMNWEASYNAVAPPKGNALEIVGWVTLDNQSGRTFRDARIKLMAGDVNKSSPSRQEWQWGPFRALEGAGVNSVHQSRKKPSTSIICTHWSTRQLFMTVKPSKWNLSAPQASSRKRSMSTTASKSTRTTGVGHMRTSGNRRVTARSPIQKFG